MKNDQITNDNVTKTETGQGNDYAACCLLDYVYFKMYHKKIAVDLLEQQAPDTYPKAIQQINFTSNLNWEGNTTMILIIEEAKETILDFSQGTLRILKIYFVLT